MDRSIRRYITGFDGLRTIGVLGVILYHLNPDFFSGGYLGVPIFLALSGYLITDQILRSLRKRRVFNFKTYYWKRIKRLYPGLLLMLLSASSYIVFFQKNLLAHLRAIFVANILNVYNFWQIAHGQSYFERFAGNQSPFTHMWTLSIQGQFYFLWPLILVFFLRFVSEKRILGLCFLVTCMSAFLMAFMYNPQVDPSRVYYGTDTRIFSIFLGCLLAFIWPTDHLRKNILKKDKIFLNFIGGLAFIGMILFMLKMKANQPFAYRGGILIFSVLVTILIAVIAHPASFWNRLLTNPLFSGIGKLSYEIYLYQFPVMVFFEAKVMNLADHRILYPVIEVSLIIIISWFSYYLVERPLAQQKWSNLLRLTFSHRHWSYKLGLSLMGMIIISGAYALIKSGQVTAINVNHSQLAQNIKENHHQNNSNNRRIVQKMHDRSDKQSSKNSDKSNKQVIKWRQRAQMHPVNRSYEKMGLSQFDLQRAHDLPALAIGDSVMVDGSSGLRKIFPNMIINADVSRGIDVALNLLQDYKDKGILPEVVVLGMGTNGMISAAQIKQAMQIVGPQRQVFWINVHVPTKPWEKPVNNILNQQAHNFANLQIIDWYNYAQEHSNWFFEDHVHTNKKGSKHYSFFIAQQILKKVKY